MVMMETFVTAHSVTQTASASTSPSLSPSSSTPPQPQLLHTPKSTKTAPPLSSSFLTSQSQKLVITVFSWGSNKHGELGLGSSQSVIGVDSPQEISQLRSPWIGKDYVRHCYTSTYYTPGNMFSLKSNGILEAWGRNSKGELGVGDTRQKSAPTLVSALAGTVVIQLSLSDHVLALLSSGDIYSWGQNNFGQLGLLDTQDRITPIRINTMIDIPIKTVYCKCASSFALSDTNQLYAWGSNKDGILGIASNTAYLTHPTHSESASNLGISKFSPSCTHSFILTHDGKVYGWGTNSHGLYFKNALLLLFLSCCVGGVIVILYY